MGTVEQQEGTPTHDTWEDIENERKFADEPNTCHLVNVKDDGENDTLTLCGHSSAGRSHIELTAQGRNIVDKLGGSHRCNCGMKRCWRCVELYGAFKGVTW